MLDNSSGVKTRHQKFPQLQSEQLLKRFLTNVFDSAEYYFYFSISLVKKYVQHVTQTAIFSSPQVTFATSCCSLHQFFLPPSSSSLKYFGLLSSEEVVFREVLGLGCVPASVRASLCPWIYKHVPSISSFHRQGLCGRQISSFPLCLSKLSSSLSNFPPQRPTRTHFTHLRETQSAPFFPCCNLFFL